MTSIGANSDIDWLACELIETVPGKVSGQPVVRGTRMLPDAIVDSFDLGETIDELREGFPSLSVAQIKRLIEFAHARRGGPVCEGVARRNPDRALRKLLGPHEVVTVTYMGWSGLKNGELRGRWKAGGEGQEQIR